VRRSVGIDVSLMAVADSLDKLMAAAAQRIDYPKFLWRFVLSDHAQVQEAHTQLVFVCLYECNGLLLIL
jgi:hypothetical protein